jgi:hypothetical protein
MGMPFRFRVVLPVVFGFLAVVLMLWDYENNRMIELMGMAWDLGPPVWPYQVVYTALFAINAPAFVISFPLLKLLNLQALVLQYAIWLPAIAGWWWWVGTRIDFPILGRARFRYPKTLTTVLIIASLALIYLGASVALQEVHWWIQHADQASDYRVPTLLRTGGPLAWSSILAAGCAVASVRLLRMKAWQQKAKHLRYRPILIVAACAALYVFEVHLWDKALGPHFNYEECEIDRLFGLGCIHGTVVDETGNPISHVEVDLIPTGITDDARRYATNTQWTDEEGRYNLNQRDAGEYFLAVNASGGPDHDRPYATAYYPSAEKEAEAVPVRIEPSTALHLPPIRVHRLEIATIKINVLWSDGTRPQRSNIYFKNLSYPRQTVTAPQIDDGAGEYKLPKGFEYEAFASVACDAGKTIESRESLPYHRIKVAGSQTLPDVSFVIKGPPCVLWQPD